MSSEIKTKNLGLNQWQGNEYLKREDLNEDNKKIDDAMGKISKEIEGIEVTAEKTKLNNTNFKSDNVNGALDELFQYANEGKTMWADVIGKPAMPNNTFQDLKNMTQADKNNLAMYLRTKNIPSQGYENLDELIKKVQLIKTPQFHSTEITKEEWVTERNVIFNKNVNAVIFYPKGSSYSFRLGHYHGGSSYVRNIIEVNGESIFVYPEYGKDELYNLVTRISILTIIRVDSNSLFGILIADNSRSQSSGSIVKTFTVNHDKSFSDKIEVALKTSASRGGTIFDGIAYGL